jgi:hypothetical protein
VSDETRRRLEAAGERPVPPPDPAFAAALEARLRAVAASLPAASGQAGDPAPGATAAAGPAPSWPAAPAADPGATRSRRRLPRVPVLTLAGATALAAVVIALGLGLGRPQEVQTPELAGPVNVSVSMPDGTVLEDPDGILLPDGAVVVVGDEGSARIGDTVLLPGDVATVHEGKLHVEHGAGLGVVPETATPNARSTPDRTQAASPPPTTAPSRSPAAPSPSTAPPTTGPTPTPTPGPDRTPAPTQVPQGSEVPPATATPAPTPTPTPIIRPHLRARLLVVGPRVAVTWTETYRAKAYVLIVTVARSGVAPDPVYPGSRELGTFARPPDLPLRFRVPDGVTELKLQVIALRGNGTVLRRSNIVTVEVPAVVE